ncbi:hypothetical protein [Corynebacterium casei]|uniref:hypothetical protein n=1 Tax=Corynebacterium casei TaxID=160386 RepID=UPI003FCF3E2E
MVTVLVPYWVAMTQSIHVQTKLGNRSTFPLVIQNNPDLQVTGVELVHAAVFSGRPWTLLSAPSSVENRRFAQWRVDSFVNLLEGKSNGAGGVTLRRTSEFFGIEVDPTEKSQLNYILGGTLAKAYLSKKLGIGWIAHYTLFSKRLTSPILQGGRRTEPDYIGVDLNGNFIVAEAKGRIGQGKFSLKRSHSIEKELNQKRQTGVVASVNGSNPVNRYGVAAMSYVDQISLFVTDPDENYVVPTISQWVSIYYAYVQSICQTGTSEMEGNVAESQRFEGEPSLVPVDIFLPQEVITWVENLEDFDFERFSALTESIRNKYSGANRIVMTDLTVWTIRS